MIVTEEMMDRLVKQRLEKIAEQKKPIFRPRLKVHKLFGEKRLASFHVGSDSQRLMFPFPGKSSSRK